MAKGKSKTSCCQDDQIPPKVDVQVSDSHILFE